MLSHSSHQAEWWREKVKRSERDLSQNHSSTKKCVMANIKMEKLAPPFSNPPSKTDANLSSFPVSPRKVLFFKLFGASGSRGRLGAGRKELGTHTWGQELWDEQAQAQHGIQSQKGTGTHLCRILQTLIFWNCFCYTFLHYLFCSLFIFN